MNETSPAIPADLQEALRILVQFKDFPALTNPVMNIRAWNVIRHYAEAQ